MNWLIWTFDQELCKVLKQSETSVKQFICLRMTGQDWHTDVLFTQLKIGSKVGVSGCLIHFYLYPAKWSFVLGLSRIGALFVFFLFSKQLFFQKSQRRRKLVAAHLCVLIGTVWSGSNWRSYSLVLNKVLKTIHHDWYCIFSFTKKKRMQRITAPPEYFGRCEISHQLMRSVMPKR